VFTARYKLSFKIILMNLPVFRFSPASTIPPLFHSHFHLSIAIIRRTSGRSLVAFKESSCFFSDIGAAVGSISFFSVIWGELSVVWRMPVFGMLVDSSRTYKTLKVSAVGSTETSYCVHLPAVQCNIPEDQSPCSSSLFAVPRCYTPKPICTLVLT